MAMRWKTSFDAAILLGGYNEYLWYGGSGMAWFGSGANASVLNGTAYRNGTQISQSALQRTLEWQIIVLTTTASTRIQNIGAERYNVGRFFDGDIGEMFVFDYLLSDVQRQRIEGYLAQKWGLAGSLIANHPYITAVPVFN